MENLKLSIQIDVNTKEGKGKLDALEKAFKKLKKELKKPLGDIKAFQELKKQVSKRSQV